MSKKILSALLLLGLTFSGAYAQKKLAPIQTKNAKAESHARKLLAGEFAIDPAHTRVSFIVPHLVISEVEGRFDDVQGMITMGKNIQGSKFTATVPVGSINTGVAKRDEHLKSEDFFDVKKYPDMKFESKTITGTLSNFKMVASLTIKDVTKDVLFSGTYTGSVKDAQGKERVGLKATGKINRRDFNVNYSDSIDLGPVVGNEVEIRIWAEAIKQ
jgi:polyisoprenoid-binding protein YceI